MPDELKKEPQENIAVVKSKRRSSLFTKLRDKFPHINKRLGILTFIILAIPLTVGLALIQQELRSRADQGDRKPMFLGMSRETNNNYKTDNCSSEKNCIERDLELIKSETGAYPAVYTVFANMDIDKAKTLAIFRYLDSKGISPALYLMPQSNSGMEIKEARLILSNDTRGYPEVLPFPGEIRFNNSDPKQITKIYVSVDVTSSDSSKEPVAPNSLALTWKKGETIEIFGSKPDGKVDYEKADPSFKFTITEDSTKTNYGHSTTIYVKPLKTTPLENMFAPGKAVFITPSDVLAKKYGNANIARGELDDKFTAYAEVIKEYGKPVLLRYAHEMNGYWFPWSEGAVSRINENAEKEEKYGRHKYFEMNNNKENYVASWKHIYTLMKQIAPNIRFFWCSIGVPDGEYFPGDPYVDYVGFDTYSGIGIKGKHDTLISRASKPINALMRLSSKKIIIGETGINSVEKQIPENQFPAYRKNWLKEGYQALYDFSPKVAGIIYFNLDMRDKGEPPNNWLLSNAFKPIAPTPPPNIEIASVYRALLLNPRFQGKFEKQSSSPTPSSTPIPTPPPGEELPFGYHDTSSCTVSTGWACDENNYNKPVSVELFDGPKSEGVSLGRVTADKPRESAVGEQCGGVNNHGFSFNTPDSIKNGASHRIYAYAIDDQDRSVSSRLSSSPKVVSCAGSPLSPTPTPPDPIGCVRKLPVVSYKDTSKSGKRKGTVIYRITIKNNDTGCNERKVALDLNIPANLPRWTYSPESVKLAPNETKTVDFEVTSGKYASSGVKLLNLTISGAYRPHTIFSVQTLQYKVIE